MSLQTQITPESCARASRKRHAFDWLPWQTIDRLLLPVVFFLFAFVGALTLWQLLMAHRGAEIRSLTHEQVAFVKSKMESELGARILPLERLAEHWSVHGQPDRLEDTPGMVSEAELVMSAYPGRLAIEWVDPTFHVRWVQTPSGADGAY